MKSIKKIVKFKGKIKKYMCISSLLFVLLILLFFSYSEEVELFNSIWALETDESSISTEDSNEETADDDSNDMIQLLARLINGEARGESYTGQVAVGAVVMNRVKDEEFPDTISGVIYQKGQFSSITDGQFDKEFEDEETVYKAAQDAFNGVDPTNGSVYFYNPNATSSKYLFSRETVVTIGSHVFAK